MLLSIALLAAAPASFVPVTVGTVGRLLDATDKPVVGQPTLTVTLWDGDAATAQNIWSETYQVTTDKDGLYAILLGDTTGGKKALTADAFAGDRWLSVTIGGEELLPRLHLSSVPYALQAQNAQTLGGKALADLDARYVQVGGSGGSGSITVGGDITASGKFTGDGSGLTNLSAAAVTGKLAATALPADAALLDAAQTFTAAQTFGAVTATTLTASGAVSTGALTAASVTSSGALSAASVTASGNITASSGAKFVGDGSGLMNLAAANVSGTLAASAVPLATSSANGAMTSAEKTYVDAAIAGSGAARSCEAILKSGASTGDGVYNIQPDPTQAAFAAYCDMTHDGGGWTLLMKTTGTDQEFAYASAHWTTADTLSPANPSPTATTNAKYPAFNTLVVQDVRAVFPNVLNAGGNGGGGYTSPSASTTYPFIMKARVGGFTALQNFQMSRWVDDPWAVPYPSSVWPIETGFRRYGFNLTGCSSSNVRWGWQFNNEVLDCNSVDTGAGIGIANSNVAVGAWGTYTQGSVGNGNYPAAVSVWGR